MARSLFPRSAELHERAAAGVLRQHASRTSRPIELPVPVELIIEQTFELEVQYAPLEEEPGVKILGALKPSDRCIILNEAHVGLFGDVIGPERFTLGHELGHWMYDAENPDQLTLDFDAAETGLVFCYHREGPGLDEQTRIREINANGFASALLMPADLVRKAAIPDSEIGRRRLAHQWGVSFQAFGFRLDKLGYG